MKKSVTLIALVALFSGCVSKESSVREVRIGSVVTDEHPSNKSLMHFAKIIEEKTKGRYTFTMFPNSVLGSEREMMEQVQQGVLDVIKGGQILSSFHAPYSIIGLPYIFASDEHFYRVLESSTFGDKVFKNSLDKGFITLSYLDKGARSFYTKNKPIIVPDDLKGLKIRAVNEPISMKTVSIMGGSAVPMAYSEVYTALQQGVIDGAESDETVLTVGKHGEIAKAFSSDKHQRFPDFITLSKRFWESLSREDQIIFQEAADEAREFHKDLWAKSIKETTTQAKAMGVTFYESKIDLFMKKAKPILEEQKNISAENRELIELIESLQ